jgi:hypothetical protein
MANSLALDKVGTLWYFDVGGFSGRDPWYAYQDDSGNFTGSGWDWWTDAPDLNPTVPLKAVRNADGRLEVFGVLADTSELAHSWQTSPSGTSWTWSPWESLGGGPITGYDVILDVNGNLEAVSVTSGGVVQVARQGQSSGTGWTGWTQPPSSVNVMAGNPVIASNANGRLQVFGITTGNRNNNYVASSVQQQPGGDSWSPFYELIDPTDAQVTGSLTVAANTGQRLEIFANNDQGQLLHAWQTEPNSSWTGSWSSFSGSGPDSGTVAAANLSDGRLQLLAVGGGPFYSNWQGPGGQGGWVGWRSFTPTQPYPFESVQMAANIHGELVAMCVSTYWYCVVKQTAPTSGWGAWYMPWRTSSYPPAQDGQPMAAGPHDAKSPASAKAR